VASSIRWGDWGRETENGETWAPARPRCSWSERPARNQVHVHAPRRGQYRTVMPRGPSPVVLHLAAACEDFSCRRRHPRALAQPRCCCRPGAAPSPTRLSPLLAALSPARSTSAAAPMAYCRHLCRARTRMREIWCVSGVWRALGEHVLDRFAAAAPAALVWLQE